MDFWSKNYKMENHHQILHIGISQGSKFQLQETILIFLKQTCLPKKYFRSKIEKMNVTIESFILELV